MAGQPAATRSLGPRGKSLYKELHSNAKVFDPLTELLIVEACRVADRLERLHGISQGETQEWLRFKDNNDNDVTLYIDSLLGEMRHQATVLKQLVAEITKTSKPADAAPKKETNVLDELAAARQSRRAASASSRRSGL